MILRPSLHFKWHRRVVELCSGHVDWVERLEWLTDIKGVCRPKEAVKSLCLHKRARFIIGPAAATGQVFGRSPDPKVSPSGARQGLRKPPGALAGKAGFDGQSVGHLCPSYLLALAVRPRGTIHHAVLCH